MLDTLKDDTLEGFHGNQIFLLHLLLQTMVGDSLFIIPDDLVKLIDQLLIQVQLVFGMSQGVIFSQNSWIFKERQGQSIR